MICDRCEEVTETYMTEEHGEICEACLQAIQQEKPPPIRPSPPPRPGRVTSNSRSPE